MQKIQNPQNKISLLDIPGIPISPINLKEQHFIDSPMMADF